MPAKFCAKPPKTSTADDACQLNEIFGFTADCCENLTTGLYSSGEAAF
jgi:hypothetical protein